MTTTMAQLLDGMGQVRLNAADRYAIAQDRFAHRDYLAAADLLEKLVEEYPEKVSVRLLLARSYYHSARLSRAAEQAERVVAQDPAEAYAQLLLGRTLQRMNRPEDAQGPLRLAAAMGLEA